MPTTVKHDLGIVKRWVKDGVDISKAVLSASVLADPGVVGVVFQKGPPIVERLYCTIRNWHHPQYSNNSFMSFNLNTGYFAGNADNRAYNQGMSGSGDYVRSNSFDPEFIPGLQLNGVAVGWFTNAFKYQPNNGPPIYTHTFGVNAIPGLIMTGLEDYSSATVRIEPVGGDTTFPQMTAYPTRANGWILSFNADDNQGDWYSDWNVYITLQP